MQESYFNTDDRSYLNVLLHGFFLMEFAGENLFAHAPAVQMHRYAMGSAGNLIEIPALTNCYEIDMTKGSLAGLLPGNVNDFCDVPQIPQFSRAGTNGVGNLTGTPKVSIKFEKPDKIIPLRCGLLEDFKKVTCDGEIKTRILASCGTKGNPLLALVTCLRYRKSCNAGSPPDSTYSFYAEHAVVPSPGDMNKAYCEASTMFNTGKNFDLRFITDSSSTLGNQRPDTHPGYGITPDDELSLAELLPPKEVTKGVNVSNCIQFGVNP